MILNIAVILSILVCSESMTMKQLKSTGKSFRKTCMAKTGVDEAKIDGITTGEFIDETDVKCYMACVLKMCNAIKNGKMNYESAMKQADIMLPEEIKEPTKVAITACKKVGDNHKDICEAAFHTMKCVYKENPSAFYFA